MGWKCSQNIKRYFPNKHRTHDVAFDDQNVDGVNKDILNYRNRRSFNLKEPNKHTYPQSLQILRLRAHPSIH